MVPWKKGNQQNKLTCGLPHPHLMHSGLFYLFPSNFPIFKIDACNSKTVASFVWCFGLFFHCFAIMVMHVKHCCLFGCWGMFWGDGGGMFLRFLVGFNLGFWKLIVLHHLFWVGSVSCCLGVGFVPVASLAQMAILRLLLLLLLLFVKRGFEHQILVTLQVGSNGWTPCNQLHCLW